MLSLLSYYRDCTLYPHTQSRYHPSTEAERILKNWSWEEWGGYVYFEWNRTLTFSLSWSNSSSLRIGFQHKPLKLPTISVHQNLLFHVTKPKTKLIVDYLQWQHWFLSTSTLLSLVDAAIRHDVSIHIFSSHLTLKEILNDSLNSELSTRAGPSKYAARCQFKKCGRCHSNPRPCTLSPLHQTTKIQWTFCSYVAV